MFWAALFDQNNITNRKHFSDHLRAVYGNKGSTPTGTPKTLPPNPNIKTPSGTAKPDVTKQLATTKRPEPPTRPSKWNDFKH